MYYFKVENKDLFACPRRGADHNIELSTEITGMFDGISYAINSILSSVHWIISDTMRDDMVIDIDNHPFISNLMISDLYNEHGKIIINKEAIKQYINKEICNILSARIDINVIFLRDVLTKKKFNKDWIYLSAKYIEGIGVYENKTEVHNRIKKDKNRLSMKRKLLFDTKYVFSPEFSRAINIRFESNSEYVLWKLGQKCATNLKVTKLDEIQQQLKDAKIIYSHFDKAFK